MANVVLFGECMAELRSLGQGKWQQGFAGDTYNTAVYLKRLDRRRQHDIQFACGVGDDPFARDMVNAWREEKVGDAFAHHVPGRSTGLYSIAVDATGERHFAYWRDTSAARGYFDDAETLLEQNACEIDWLYLSGVSLAILPVCGLKRLARVCDAVQAQGGKVVFDNNYRPRLWPSREHAEQTMCSFIERCDIALITLDDQALLMGKAPDRAFVDECLAFLPDEVVVKRGRDSTLVRLRGGPVHSVTVTPVQVVDTTAAGDSFAACYLSARMQGAPVERATLLGNALASRVIQHPGALMPAQALFGDDDFWHLIDSD
jgi:2-dehydro-3-deoxygluconokinase